MSSHNQRHTDEPLELLAIDLVARSYGHEDERLSATYHGWRISLVRTQLSLLRAEIHSDLAFSEGEQARLALVFGLGHRGQRELTQVQSISRTSKLVPVHVLVLVWDDGECALCKRSIRPTTEAQLNWGVLANHFLCPLHYEAGRAKRRKQYEEDRKAA